MVIDHSNPYIHSTTVLCDRASIDIRVSHAGVTALPPGGRPPLPALAANAPGVPPATGAQLFKVWLDNLFIVKRIQGNLVEDGQGRRFHGLFDHMSCTEANRFIQAIGAYDWGPARRFNAGTLFIVSGHEGRMAFTSQVVGPFRGQQWGKSLVINTSHSMTNLSASLVSHEINNTLQGDNHQEVQGLTEKLYHEANHSGNKTHIAKLLCGRKL